MQGFESGLLNSENRLLHGLGMLDETETPRVCHAGCSMVVRQGKSGGGEDALPRDST
jgi:hypothetical protein